MIAFAQGTFDPAIYEIPCTVILGFFLTPDDLIGIRVSGKLFY